VERRVRALCFYDPGHFRIGRAAPHIADLYRVADGSQCGEGQPPPLGLLLVGGLEVEHTARRDDAVVIITQGAFDGPGIAALDRTADHVRSLVPPDPESVVLH